MLHLKTTTGARPTTRPELVRLVRDAGVPASSPVVSTDGGVTWTSIDAVIGARVEAIDERMVSAASLTSFAAEPALPHTTQEAARRRRLMTAFAVAFFAVFTPWLYLRASDGDETLSATPLGISLWWGSLCALATALGACAAALELALPRLARLREAARWVYVIAAGLAVILPAIGYAMAWGAVGLTEPLAFLYDARHTISLWTIPLGLAIEVLAGLVALAAARGVWKERKSSAPVLASSLATPAVAAAVSTPAPA